LSDGAYAARTLSREPRDDRAVMPAAVCLCRQIDAAVDYARAHAPRATNMMLKMPIHA